MLPADPRVLDGKEMQMVVEIEEVEGVVVDAGEVEEGAEGGWGHEEEGGGRLGDEGGRGQGVEGPGGGGGDRGGGVTGGEGVMEEGGGCGEEVVIIIL